MPELTINLPTELIRYIQKRAVATTGDISPIVIGALRRDRRTRNVNKKAIAEEIAPAVAMVNKAVCDAYHEVCLFGLSEGSMTGAARLDQIISTARMVSWHILRKLGMSYPQIGKAFNRDHSTIMYGTKKIVTLSETYPDVLWFMVRSTELSGIPVKLMPDKPARFSFIPQGSGNRLEDDNDLGPKKAEHDWTAEEKRDFKRFLRTDGKNGRSGRVKSTGGNHVRHLTVVDDSIQDYGRSYSG